MSKNQESQMFLMGEFALMLALKQTYNLGGGGIFSSTPGFETNRRRFYL